MTNNSVSVSLYIKLVLFLAAILFSLMHPVTVALLSVSYFFVTNLTVEEAALLKQKTKQSISKVAITVIEKEVMPRLSSYVKESKGALPSSPVEEVQPILPSSKESIKLLPESPQEEVTVMEAPLDLPGKYALLFGDSFKFPKTKGCFTKQYNSQLESVIASWDIDKRQQFVTDFAEILSKKTKERILSTSIKSLPVSSSEPITIPTTQKEKVTS